MKTASAMDQIHSTIKAIDRAYDCAQVVRKKATTPELVKYWESVMKAAVVAHTYWTALTLSANEKSWSLVTRQGYICQALAVASDKLRSTTGDETLEGTIGGCTTGHADLFNAAWVKIEEDALLAKRLWDKVAQIAEL